MPEVLEETIQKRRAEVEHMQMHNDLEGLTQDPKAEAIQEKFIQGELSADETKAQLVALYTGGY